MKGIIAIPTTGMFHYNAVISLINLHSQAPVGSTFKFLTNSLIYYAREEIVNHMMDNDYEWVILIDDDVIVPANTIDKLLSHDKEIVSSIVYRRFRPYQPCMYDICKYENGKVILRATKDWNKELIEVAACGTGCILIRRKVFEKISKPWFFPMPVEHLGEDLSFCLRARAAGFKIYCDTTLECGHVTDVVVDRQLFELQNVEAFTETEYKLLMKGDELDWRNLLVQQE